MKSHLSHLRSSLLVVLNYLDLKDATFSFDLANDQTVLKVGLVKEGQDSSAEFLVYDFENEEIRWDIEQLDLSPGLLPFFLDSIEQVSSNAQFVSDHQFKFIQQHLSGAATPGVDSSLTELLEKSCAVHKNNIAYTYNNQQLTYAELNGYANYYAQLLISQQTRKGDLVFVCLDNGLELPVAYFACMKVGAVFVPVDPLWPESRMAALEAKFKPRCVLSNSSISLERASLIEENPTIDISGTDALYAFFTSGSTGLPKCCLNRHDGLINRFNYMTRVFNILPGKDIILQNSSHLFDSSLWQLLWPLLSGVQVVIPRRTPYPDIDYMLDLIERYQVTMTDFVPSIFNLLVQKIYDQPAYRKKLRSCKYLIVGGEESNVNYLKKFHNMFPDVQLVNTYGHTEASIGMVFNFMHPPAMEKEAPIGRPIDNTFVVIADDEHNIKPVGAIGKIYVAGVCVGNGYFLDEEKTASTFYENPFQHIPASTIFNTGDYGYLDENGMLYYKGRYDDQIKIGGIRLDLQEIEWELQQHPQVEQAKVYYRNESKSLHAFIKAQAAVDLNELLRQRLPKHAVPHSITTLDKFPLNANGKIDREALFSKLKEPAQASKNETSLKAHIVQKWKDHIGIDHITTNTSYFQLGGSSLSAISMLLDLEREFNIRIHLPDLSQDFTIDNLVDIIRFKKDKRAPQTTATQIQADRKELLDEISKLHFSAAQPGKNFVLLTGATGFFGSMLLTDLIINTDLVVYCLVRAKDLTHARVRIQDSLKKYCAFEPASERIIPLCGDLCEPYLGLSPGLFAELSTQVDCIIHAGAVVDLIKSYRELRASNSMPTRYLVELAATSKLKSIHFISSISAEANSGYEQTKWLAESVLMEAAEKHGLPVAIYRFGEIGNYKRGQANDRSVLVAFLKTMISVGLAPVVDLSIDYYPGEMASRFVVERVCGQAGKECYDVIANDSLTVKDLAELAGNIKLVDLPFFLEEVKKRKKTHPASYLEIITFILSDCSREDPLTAIFYDRKNSSGKSNHKDKLKLLIKDMIQDNQTTSSQPAFVAFGDILRRWSASTPGRIALQDENNALSYSAMDDLSDRMAADMITHGLQKGDRVAVFAHKRVECILTIFAVLKSGAVYVPIDPKNPVTRLAGILDEVNPKICVGQEEDLPKVQSWGSFIDMDKLLNWVPGKPKGALPTVTEDDMCYIIYTSGSTGRPKGVQITHKNTAAFFSSIEQRYIMDNNAKCLTTIPYYFDGSISDTFYSLYKGAFVLITPALPIPSLLIEMIEEHQVTHIVAVTSILKLLSESFLENIDRVKTVKTILTGGEACDKQVVNNLIGAFPELTITNAYGPTEATCDSITYTIHRNNLITGKDQEYPIGKPLRTIEAYLVDVDENGIGELCLGGDQLFSAYFNRPEETARVFRTINGSRCYTTGDLCRIDENGDYIFIGRRDDEIKLNGNRVHLSEIKNALTRVAGIRAVEIIAIDVRGQKQICSFFEPENKFDYDDFEELRENLKNMLPSYMLPRFYLQMMEWPLVPSQKIDRKKLSKIIELGSVERSIYFDVQQEKATAVIPQTAKL